MISYYSLDKKQKQEHQKKITKNQIISITEQAQLKQAISSKEITHAKILSLRNSNVNDKTLQLLWTITGYQYESKGQLKSFMPLEEINLNENFSFITDKALESICQCTNIFPKLRKLCLGDNAITDDGIALLCKSEYFNIEQLILFGNSGITSQSLVIMSQSPAMSKLKVLDIHATSVDDLGVQQLFRTPKCTHLQILNISMSWNRITDHCLVSIAQSKHCKSLKQLYFEDCGITDQGIAYLSQSQNMQFLQTLVLNNSISTQKTLSKNNIITDDSLKYLAYATKINNLKVLQLRNTEVSSKGIRTFAVSLTSEKLQKLRLSHCANINQDAIVALQNIINYLSLKKLYVNSTSIKQEECQKLQNKYKQVHVIY